MRSAMGKWVPIIILSDFVLKVILMNFLLRYASYLKKKKEEVLANVNLNLFGKNTYPNEGKKKKKTNSPYARTCNWSYIRLTCDYFHKTFRRVETYL